MSKTQITILIIAVVFILAGATMLYISPSKRDMKKKLVARSHQAKKQLWQFRAN